MKKAITILAICSLLLTACGQIDDTESKSETTTAIASERRKGYKRSHNYYEKEFADGILFLKADGYYCNYHKEIRFVRCFGKLNSGTKQFRAE